MLKAVAGNYAGMNHPDAEHFTRIVPQPGRLMTRASDRNVYQHII